MPEGSRGIFCAQKPPAAAVVPSFGAGARPRFQGENRLENMAPAPKIPSLLSHALPAASGQPPEVAPWDLLATPADARPGQRSGPQRRLARTSLVQRNLHASEASEASETSEKRGPGACDPPRQQHFGGHRWACTGCLLIHGLAMPQSRLFGMRCLFFSDFSFVLLHPIPSLRFIAAREKKHTLN